MDKIPFKLTLLILILIPSQFYGQYIIKGKIIDPESNPVINISILDNNESEITKTDIEGRFILEFENVDPVTLIIDESNYQYLNRIVVPGDNNELVIQLEYRNEDEEFVDFQVVSLSSDEVSQGNSVQNISSILQASRDVFANITAFQFGAARFRVRGLNGHNSRMFLNGMPVNDLDDGRVNWSYWGGLNDVLRNRQSTFGLEASEFTFGDLAGTQSIDLRARFQRKQIRPSFAISNRSYRNRAMFTYSTGLIDKKFALSFSASRRWGNEGFVEATFYDSYSYFLSADYLINEKNALNIAVVGAPTQRGRGSSSVQEMNDLSGNNFYNPNWGFQNGEKRNSRIYNTHQPIFILRHDLELNQDFSLTTSLSYLTGRFGSSRLDWYNVSDPRPDYYRKLPSFYKDSPDLQEYLTAEFENNVNVRQINWDYLYFINRNIIEDFENANGVEGAVESGYRAKYILGEQRFDTDKIALNSNLKYKLTDQFSLYGGIMLQQEDNHNFQNLLDLLGADYYVDIDRFAERDFPNSADEAQNDLDNPNRITYEGDIYGYNYTTTTRRGDFWAQGQYKSRYIDVFLATELSYTSFWRTGKMRNGRFPENSLGKSDVLDFFNYGLKAGLSYKIDGRNYVNLIANYETNAPFTRFSFVSPRTRNDLVEGLESNRVFSSELSYHHRSPGLKAKASAFFVNIQDLTEVTSFYHDELRGFVNFILTGIDQTHYGTELAADLKLSTTLNLVAAASLGKYVYSSRPSATISQDNNAELLEVDQTIYQNNFFIPNNPQQAMTVGLKYNSPKFWFCNINFNYFDQMYIDFNPTRRTSNAVDGIIRSESPELWEDILFQERLPGNYTVDLFGGKSWKIGDRFIYLTIGINNILNNRSFRTGGYEQNRFDFETKDVERFPSRYFYAYGTNYFIGLSFRL